MVGLLSTNVLFTRFLTVLILSTAWVGSALARPDTLLYPEAVFPELTPLLLSALDRSPELESLEAAVEDRRGQALSQSAASRSRVTAHTQVLGGYEMRYNPETQGGRYDEFEGQSRFTVNGSVWWYKPIYYWGNTERQRHIADLHVTASELEFVEASRRHLSEVREVYLLWIASRHQYAVAAETIELAERFVNNRRELLRIGRTSEQEVLELEAALYEAEETLAQYSRERTYLRNQLLLMVGDETMVDGLERAEFPEVPLLDDEGLARLRAGLQAEDPDSIAVQRQELFAEADETFYEAVKRDRRPTFDLVVGAASDRLDTYDINDSAFRVSSYAGVQMRWNIFDGHRNRGDRMSALARLRGREAQARRTEAEVRSGAERLLANIELNVRQVEARSARAELLARRLNLAENPDSAELIAANDRLELRLDLLRARTRVIDAQIQYLVHMSRLAALYFPDPVSGR